MQCESVKFKRNCRVRVCGRRLSPVLRRTGPMSASSLCVAASTSPPYIYIYDSLSIGASGCNRLKGHIYICVCAFFLLDIFFTPLTLTYPHEARAGQVFYGEKRMSKNMTWPFRAYLPVLAPALMLLLPTAPAPLTSHLTQQLLTHSPKKHPFPTTKTHIFLTRLTTTSIRNCNAFC